MPTSTQRTPRVLWKGAISFGLVHIPVALYSATTDHAVDFDWLDKRTMDPVGYKRINKKTGKEIEREQIVKGVEYEKGHYVVLTDEEIASAFPTTTQTVEIESFVPAGAIPFVYLERPYYVAPINRGAKVYALLRETLQRSERVGVARVVIQTKQHLAVLVPVGPGLVLNLLRWGEDIRPWTELPLPAENAKKAGLTERELGMAKQLVEEMSADWNPDDYKDSFKDEIMGMVDRKVESGRTEQVEQPEAAETRKKGGADIIDLTELLQRSLRKGRSKGADDAQADDSPASGKRSVKSAAKASAAGAGKATAKSAGKTAAKTTAKTTAKAPAKTARKAAETSSPSAKSSSKSAGKRAASSAGRGTGTAAPRRKAA